MLVDVVLMREGGRKLDSAAIGRAEPVRGLLVIRTELWRESWLPNGAGTPITFVTLRDPVNFDPARPTLLPELRQAQVRRLADSNLVIVGLHRTSHVSGKEKDEAQAWWCRLVTTSAGA